jgi:putative membrane protein
MKGAAMGEGDHAASATATPSAGAGQNLSLISTQLSWMRSDLSNLRTLLAWARTSVSMIGFGFTIYNFYRGFFEDLAAAGRSDAARNLGVGLVAAGTLAMVVAILNFWTTNRSLQDVYAALEIPKTFKHRWVYSYLLSAILIVIGLATLLFMLRVG